MLYFVVGTIMHGYNTVEHSVTGMVLIIVLALTIVRLYLFRCLLTILSTQEVAVIL